ncbi:MAG: c-type cytochrome [Rhodocyclales bacterium]|nr:c-type cytochrome [Rhodocyclales bacterium]
MTCIPRSALATAAVGIAALMFSAAASALDADAAKELATDNDCFKCHAVDKTKKGPSYKKIAAKYKGKEAEGEKAILKNLTTGPKVKLEDGTEEEHKIIDTKDPKAIKNLADWILSR